MNDEWITAVAVMWVTTATALAAVFIFGGSLDANLIRACESRGYWQMGQTRIICSVEGKQP